MLIKVYILSGRSATLGVAKFLSISLSVSLLHPSVLLWPRLSHSTILQVIYISFLRGSGKQLGEVTTVMYGRK
jgi:hypothetical protein